MKTKNQRFQEIKKIFKENNGYIHTQDIIEAGYSYFLFVSDGRKRYYK